MRIPQPHTHLLSFPTSRLPTWKEIEQGLGLFHLDQENALRVMTHLRDSINQTEVAMAREARLSLPEARTLLGSHAVVGLGAQHSPEQGAVTVGFILMLRDSARPVIEQLVGDFRCGRRSPCNTEGDEDGDEYD